MIKETTKERIIKLGLFQYLRYKFSKRNQLLVLKIRGQKIWLRKNNVDIRVALSSLFGEFDILLEYIKSDFQGYIIDIGGYIGTSALALKTMYPNAKILVIEPSRDNFELMKKNLNQFKDIKLIYGAIVGKSSKKVNLYDRRTGPWGYTLVKNSEDLKKKKKEMKILHKVPCYKISEIIPKNSEIGIIKIDIEGGEHELFQNDPKTLLKSKVMIVELHDRIVPGCTELFHEISKNRDVFKDKFEKYISSKKE